MRLLRFVSVFAVLSVGCGALAQSATNTALAIYSGGNAVTTSREGTAVTLAATVTIAGGGAAAPPGQVNFCEVKAAPLRCTDIRLLGTVQLSSAGTAQFKFFPGAGTHIYQAVFLGTHIEAASSSSDTMLTVTPFYPTVTTLTSIGAPGDYTLTATVTTTGGTVPPTGTLSFQDMDNANYVLATAPRLLPGQASFGLGFGSATSLASAPSGTSFAATGDFNGDGRLDVVFSDGGGSYPPSIVMLGNGDGTFTPAPGSVPSIGLPEPHAIAVADFNGDGKLDMAISAGYDDNVTNIHISEIQIFLGNGDGTFTLGQTVPHGGAVFGGAALIGVGDFNGDGIPDLAVEDGSATARVVAILLGNGDGTFVLKSTAPSGSNPSAIAVGDFNGDGKADLALAELVYDAKVNPVPGSVTILLGNGDGTFTPTATSPATGVGPSSIVAADFNGDGKLDLAVGNVETLLATTSFTGSTSILLGNGDGTFTASGQIPLTVANTIEISNVAAGDFNGDGKADLARSQLSCANSVCTGVTSVLLGNGDGTFTPTPQFPGGDGGVLAAADFNGDGLADIADFSNAESYVLLSEVGPQSAAATVSGISVVGTGTHQIDAVYSGDGAYQGSTSGTIGLTAEPVPTTLTFTANPTTVNYGQQVTLTATVAPNTPQQNHLPSGTVTFSSGGAAVGTGTVSNGVATIYPTSLPSGTDTLTASYSGDANFTASTASAMEVVNGMPSATALSAAPNPAGTGQTVTLTAAVTGVGNAATPAGTVNFFDGTTLLGQGTLDATGHATYSTVALSLGTHTLTAVYAGNAIYVGSTSAAVNEVMQTPDFSVTLASPSITLQTHQHTTTMVTLASVGDFADNITLTCTSPPTYVTCIFTPASAALTANGTAAVSFYLDTDSIVGGDGLSGPLHGAVRGTASPVKLALAVWPVGLLAGVVARRRRRGLLRVLLLVVVSVPAMLAFSSCGGDKIVPIPSTAPGTYIIPVTATGAATGITHAAQLTLTVTP